MAQSKDLAAILSALDKVKYAAIIERAALNGYHDFKHDTVPDHPEYGECICPKIQLLEDLSAFPELKHISVDVMNGLYDDSMDDIDTENMRKELIDSGMPASMFPIIGLDPPTKTEIIDNDLKKTGQQN